MASEDIAILWVRDLEREAYKTHPASEVWATVGSSAKYGENNRRRYVDGSSTP